MLTKVVGEGRLTATIRTADAVSQSDMILMCVPTPIDQTKSPDYSFISEAAKTIGKSMRKGSIVVVESTVGPGTVEKVIKTVLESESGLIVGVDFGLAACPERSDPGTILKNMGSVPRVVGADSARSAEIVAAIYETAFGVKVIRMSDAKTANAVKLTENLFRDVNIALANEFALLFERLGIDSLEIINACASKCNFMPHYPGGGVGGPCLPSNSYYLIAEGQKVGNIPYLIRMAREINDRMPEHVVELLGEALNEVGKTIRKSNIGVLGVAYKPNVRDVQLTPVERVCAKLVQMGADVVVYDPVFAGEWVMGFNVKKSLQEAVSGADCVLIGTANKEFKDLDITYLSQMVNTPAALVDSRNVVDPTAVEEAGLSYRGVGRVPHERQAPVARKTQEEELLNRGKA
jgi:nucleotide sugar dehydrogenase